MNNLRKYTYNIFNDNGEQDKVARIINIFLMLIISLSVIAVVLETLPNLSPTAKTVFKDFEVFSVVIFTIEYIARVWSCVESESLRYQHPIWGRLRYMMTPMALLDLIVILPFFLVFFVNIDLRFIRVMRLLRILKLTRYSSSISLLKQVITEESKSIGAALFVLLILIIIAASLMYFAEHKAQPDAFSSIPAAMWWAVITLTTIGYGDVVPVTVIGKILAAIMGIISFGIVALPAGLLASGFNNALHRKRSQYEKVATNVMKDGVITKDERRLLHDTQSSLDISSGDARHILEETRQRLIEKNTAESIEEIRQTLQVLLHNNCPHCGKSLQDATPHGDHPKSDK